MPDLGKYFTGSLGRTEPDRELYTSHKGDNHLC